SSITTQYVGDSQCDRNKEDAGVHLPRGNHGDYYGGAVRTSYYVGRVR
ncbi:unnamed protein product, partial [marine sediment metagenome]